MGVISESGLGRHEGMDDFDFEYERELYEDDLYEHECNEVALDDELGDFEPESDEGSDGEDEDYDFEAGSQI